MNAHTFHGSPQAPCIKLPEDGPCYTCDGGLTLCVVCAGVEGALPTLCPGSRMSFTTMDRVYVGIIDFRLIEGHATWATCNVAATNFADAFDKKWTPIEVVS